MNEQVLTLVSERVVEAGRKAGLDRGPVPVFDGESWLWIWPISVPDGAAEVLVGARPSVAADGAINGAELSVSARAWGSKRGAEPWSQTFFSVYLSMSDLRQLKWPLVPHVLSDWLRRAQDGALSSQESPSVGSNELIRRFRKAIRPRRR